MSSRPTLHLTVGLPGVGKTTLARKLEQANGALRLTPDEWMAPLFGLRWADFGEKRDVLEGRLIWVGHQVLRAGVSVILDFGCWSPEERYALRAIANLAGADFELHYLTLPEDERRQRADARWRESPEEVFEMAIEDHERFRALFTPPTPDELQGCPLPPPPIPFESWPAWASDRWPTLPRLDTRPWQQLPAKLPAIGLPKATCQWTPTDKNRRSAWGRPSPGLIDTEEVREPTGDGSVAEQ